MKKGPDVSVMTAWYLVAVVVLLVAEVRNTVAVTCSPTELSPCVPAINGSQQPSQQCCAKLKEQVPCFCGYLKNPMFRPYINSPNAKKVVGACGVALPKC